jgi:hypothetical protein
VCVCVFTTTINIICMYAYMCETEHAVNVLNNLYATNQTSVLLTKPLYPHRSEVGVLETEHAVKVEALQALLLEVRIYVSSC